MIAVPESAPTVCSRSNAPAITTSWTIATPTAPIAETCGNGIRVFARYLVTAELAPAGEMIVGTRAGDRTVIVPSHGGDITVDMGPAAALTDATVGIGARTWPAGGWSMGNPHLVVLAVDSLDDLDLTAPPLVDPAASYPDGVNVEFVADAGERHIRMRVYERGVGETRSCGSGACAAAVAAMSAGGRTIVVRR